MGDSSSRTAKHKRKRQRFYSQRAALHRHPPLHHHHHGWSTTLMSYGSGKYWRGETDRVLYIHFFYIKIKKKWGGKEKEKTDCELRRVRHAIKATRAGRYLGVSVWVRLTSNPVHVRCHDCPVPWLPLQVEGWLSCRWRCRSSTAAAVCWKMVDWSIRNRRGEVP